MALTELQIRQAFEFPHFFKRTSKGEADLSVAVSHRMMKFLCTAYQIFQLSRRLLRKM
ncbi:hypothetical protein FACS1894187_24300 [Synergistales bacterium]|nr:hypothetical protein FACS1894187_24300 [Synergistales bacterium]